MLRDATRRYATLRGAARRDATRRDATRRDAMRCDAMRCDAMRCVPRTVRKRRAPCGAEARGRRPRRRERKGRRAPAEPCHTRQALGSTLREASTLLAFGGGTCVAASPTPSDELGTIAQHAPSSPPLRRPPPCAAAGASAGAPGETATAMAAAAVTVAARA